MHFTIPKAAIFTFQYPDERDYFGKEMKGLNTKKDADAIQSSIESMHKYNWYSIQDCNSTVFKNGMNREVLVYSGHGYKGSLSFPDKSYLTATALKNSNGLSRTKLAVFCACYSNSPDGDTSMTQAAIEAGAEVAIGWDYSIQNGLANKFLKKLFEYLAEGETVDTALELTKKDMFAEHPYKIDEDYPSKPGFEDSLDPKVDYYKIAQVSYAGNGEVTLC